MSTLSETELVHQLNNKQGSMFLDVSNVYELKLFLDFLYRNYSNDRLSQYITLLLKQKKSDVDVYKKYPFIENAYNDGSLNFTAVKGKNYLGKFIDLIEFTDLHTLIKQILYGTR